MKTGYLLALGAGLSGCLTDTVSVLQRDARDAAPALDGTSDAAALPDAAPSQDAPDATAPNRPSLPSWVDETWPSTDVGVTFGCEPGRWCWANPLRTGEAIFDAQASGAEAWAVGAHGLAMRWQEEGWRRVETSSLGWFTRVAPVARGDVWAVEQAPTARPDASAALWHYTDAWRRVATPGSLRPRIVQATAGGVWVAGSTSLEGIYRFADGVWTDQRAGLPAEGVTIQDLHIRGDTVWMYGSPLGGALATLAWAWRAGRWTSLIDLRPLDDDARFVGRIASSTAAGDDAFVLAVSPSRRDLWYARLSGSRANLEPTTGDVLAPGSLVGTDEGLFHLTAQGARQSDGVTWRDTGPMQRTETAFAPTALVRIEPGTFSGFNAYGDWRRFSGFGWSLQSTPNRTPLLGVGARTESLFAYGPTGLREPAPGEWPSVGAPVDLVQVVPDSSLRGLWGVTRAGAVVSVGHTEPALIPSPADTAVTRIAVRTASDAWAVAGRRLLHWDGSSWSDAPALPRSVGGVDTAGAALTHVVLLGDDVFVAGAELEGDRRGLLCRLRAGAWTCSELSDGTADPSAPHDLAAAPTVGLWLSYGARVARVDPATLARADIAASAGTIAPGVFGLNPLTGTLCLVGERIFVLQPLVRTVTRYALPTSGYASALRACNVANTGRLVVVGSRAEVLYRDP